MGKTVRELVDEGLLIEEKTDEDGFPTIALQMYDPKPKEDFLGNSIGEKND